MRRLLAVLALLCVAGPVAAAQTKTLVVYGELGATSDPVGATTKRDVNRLNTMWKSILDRWGVNTTWVRGNNIKTEWARTGVLGHNYGLGGAWTESFGAVIHIGPTIGNVFLTGYYRPDSLLNYFRGYPTVPQLFAFDDRGNVFGTGYRVEDVACCSTGVSGVSNPPFSGISYKVSDHTRTWFNAGSYQEGAIVGNTPVGGFRKHTGIGASLALTYPAYTTVNPIECLWCDSLNSLTNSDTVTVWERMFNTVSGAKPVVFAYIDGAGGPTDSIANVDLNASTPPAEVDPMTMLMALARLDSLTGNTLFDQSKLPQTRAITIDGLCSRNSRLGINPGIFNGDTAVAYGSLDSLAAYQIPVTFTVNADPDSMSVYKRDLIKAAANPAARFTPMVRTGIDSLAAMNGGRTALRRPRDIWGRYRNRAAYGDGTCAGSDTSLYCLLVNARALLDSALTSIGASGRISRFLVAPDDDWSPKNLLGIGGGPAPDSILWAMWKAGYFGVRIDGQDPASNGELGSGVARTNPCGWYSRQGIRTESVGGNQVALLAHTGFPMSGSLRSWIYFGDSVGTVGDSGSIGVVSRELVRHWAGWTQDESRDWDSFPDVAPGGFPEAWYAWRDNLAGVGRPYQRTVDMFVAPRRAYCARLTFNDLSGIPSGPPSRNGWWIIKWDWNAILTINEIAGRSIITLGYPENVTP